MIKIGIILILAVGIFVARKNIANGILGGAFLAVLIMFVIFMYDRVSFVPIREHVPLDTYDEIVQNPTEKITEFGTAVYEKGTEVGKVIVDKGDELDEYYGTGIESEETKEESKKKGKGIEKEKVKEESTEEKGNSGEPIHLEKGQYMYKNIETDLQGALANLSEKEKSIVRALQPLLKIEYTTENVLIRSTGDALFYEVLEIPTK